MLLQLLNNTVGQFPEIIVRDEEELVVQIMNTLIDIEEAKYIHLHVHVYSLRL